MAEFGSKEVINVEDLDKYRDDYKRLVNLVFATESGRQLLKQWQFVYVEGDLFGKDSREADYNIGQRDFVLEVKANMEEV